MIGQKKLYDAYMTAPSEGHRGRSRMLVMSRNRLLAARFYHFMHHRRLRYDDILSSLQSEFFLSEKRIVSCLNETKELIDELMEGQPEARELRREFPWFVWE
jgi:hypothetical protein